MLRYEKRQMMLNLWVVINRHYPGLYRQLAELPDYRSRPRYQVRELIMSGLFMFLFRQGSRNNADNQSKNMDYQDNIKQVFGVRVADMDTVNRYLKQLPSDMLEQVKYDMFRSLIRSKVLQRWRFNDKYYLLAIDGSGLQSYDYEPYPGCPYKTHGKNKKRVWTSYVLEAKIITRNGFSLSLMTEWVENPTDKEFDKQDSEYKAFIRLMHKLSKEFPRLPVMLLLDGLYPKKPVFDIAKERGYPFAITFKDKTLKSVQEQIADLKLFGDYAEHAEHSIDSQNMITEQYKVFGNIEYKGHDLCVFETLKTQKHKKTGKKETVRFVHITNLDISAKNVHNVSRTARLRWKIENEGFNIQKNTDYHLAHKYSRKSFNANKNYYQLLQISEMINQMTSKLKKTKQWMERHGLTVKHLIKKMLSFFDSEPFTLEEITEEKQNIKNVQLRY